MVLSSNDGCVVARSNEAKAIGIPMGAPRFKFKQLFIDHKVVQFSANFDLYGDVSERITRLLVEVTPQIEVYSVDESFLDLSELAIPNLRDWGKMVKHRVQKEIGVPVSIGIAHSKTLAKLTSEYAKKDPALEGVLDFINITTEERQAYLLNTPVGDLWGVGRRLSPKLRAEGITTALDMANIRPSHIQKLMGVHGLQMMAELNGTSALPLATTKKVRQSLMHGRVFGNDTKEMQVIEAVIAGLTARAALRLRKDNLLARKASVRLTTNRQRPDYQIHYAEINFDTPTADTGFMVNKLIEAFKEVMKNGLLYHRADIYLHDLVDKASFQTDLFGKVSIETDAKSQARLGALDALNDRYGKRTVRYAAEDLSGSWKPKHDLRSPRYTTHWQELPTLNLFPVIPEKSGIQKNK